MSRRNLGRVAVALVAVLLLAGLVVKVASRDRNAPRGLLVDSVAASPGYTLYSPLELEETLLVDLSGRVVHSWPTTTQPGLNQYLLPNGALLRAGDLNRAGTFAPGQGAGGRIEQLAWDGSVDWRLDYADDRVMQHHDIEPMPNGNVLFIAWERISRADAIAAGRDPALLPDDELWPDTIVEYSPAQDRIVWKWRVWDHLVQDHDPARPNYGDPAEHPRRIDVNFLLDGNDGDQDWNHLNAVAYNAERDEVMVSSRSFSELWVIDHDTTTEEAAGPAGDLRFRYGNPRAYGAGTHADQRLFVQHDAHWIADGHRGAGNLLVFSNGLPKVRPYSTVEEITPRLDADGDYVLAEDGTFAATIDRVHPRRPADRFFAPIISGVQRLPNGNTLVVYGTVGRIVEVAPNGTVVWALENPWHRINDDTPSRTGAGFVIEPWWTFQAERYPPDHPGLAGLAAGRR